MQWAFFEMIKRYQISKKQKMTANGTQSWELKKSLCQEILVSLIPAFLAIPTMLLAFSQNQFSLCIQFAMFQNGHLICQGPPLINSASQLLNSKHPWEKRNQQVKMTFFNEVTQIQCHKELFPSSSQLWPGVEQDYVEQRNWENSLRNVWLKFVKKKKSDVSV